MSATGLVVSQGTALLEVPAEVPTPPDKDQIRCFVLFGKSRTKECFVRKEQRRDKVFVCAHSCRDTCWQR